MITLSIDLSLLDRNRFKRVTRKNGKEAVFCDLVMFETPDSQFGDYVLKQQVTKEERQAKKEMPILGNAKIWDSGTGKRKQEAATESAPVANDDTDVPF